MLASAPVSAATRADLAQALLASGDLDEAETEASAALEADPTLIVPWLVRATVRKARCAYSEAAADLIRAAALAPGRAAILVNLGHCLAELGQLAHAEEVLRLAIARAPRSTEAHASLGSVLARQGRLAEAEAPCRAALALDPGLVRAHQNLSVILAGTDPAAARAHRDAAYRRWQVFIDPAPHPARTVLVLAAADSGNVPLRHLLPPARTTFIRWYIEYATPDQDRALPPFDLVFNAIGEADLAPPILLPVARMLREHAPRVLNRPDAVARTGRAGLPELLGGIAGVVVPPVVPTVETEAPAETLARAGIALPVLLRPRGAHGGEGVCRIDDAVALAAVPGQAGYATQFVDYASPDGWYRKYRVIFIDGRPFPYHLAIARQWLVHHWTAAMQDDPARCAEEARFLGDPCAALGTQPMAALCRIGERLGLEYGGIDFSLLPDGRILVFEANATMLVHPEQDPRLDYRNPAVRAIQAAFEAMLLRRQRPS